MTIGSRVGWLRAALVGLAIAGCVGSASAQEPSQAAVATARQLIDIKGGSDIYNPIFFGIIEKTKYALLQSNPMLQADLNASALQVATDLRADLETLKNEAAKIYAQHFTEQELQQALAFYKSPLGGKLIKFEPQVLDQSMKYAEGWAAGMADKVMAKMREEMHKRGHDL